MREELQRTQMLLGQEGLERLLTSRVAVFGIGGVGGYAAEALARSGVGALELVDKDVVDTSNLNRQIIALHSTVGRAKAEVMKERIRDINPEIQVRSRECFFLPGTADAFDFTTYDYVVDAVDTVTAKIEIIVRARQAGVPVISCMGAGNKLHPELFEISDIYDTSVCPLAKVMRKELKKRGIPSLKVVYSRETPRKPRPDKYGEGRIPPGSVAFVPSVVGLIAAGEVIKDLAFGMKAQKK